MQGNPLQKEWSSTGPDARNQRVIIHCREWTLTKQTKQSGGVSDIEKRYY